MSPLLSILRLAATATVWLLALGIAVAWWLARTRSRRKAPIEAILARPLVLPPAVLAFYLLLLLSARGLVGGRSAAWENGPLTFSFVGLASGLVLYALPFVMGPLQASIAVAGREVLEAAATLGAGPLDRFATVALPLARRGLLTATVLGFAHTVGEFGVVLMIGGSIPGQTKVLSIAIYDYVETLRWQQAHILSAGMLIFAFSVIFAVMVLDKRVARPGQ